MTDLTDEMEARRFLRRLAAARRRYAVPRARSIETVECAPRPRRRPRGSLKAKSPKESSS